ncbi:MAG: hypothetical protein MSA90_01005 [Faecalicatena sp.]|uniref:hypothetical protein n=1 Tax=Faecalicatena sp. TaxID=2005360 RepID=UPI002582695E|nr:hypothetical protein [Faecalicatena sp.]MCI6464033.1 hypothetical protein [Faecalicatena sp.]MDY5619241.1 hypothetical protein [Lachnospiraceae bacterium]
MTLKLTQRDKKLLIVLAVVVLIVGVGAGLLFPLMEKGQNLKEEVLNADIEQQERSQKVESLPALQKREDQVLEEIGKAQQDFYPIMQSMEIDKMLTEMALTKGLTVKDLDIKMPVTGEYTTLKDYTGPLPEEENENTEEGTVYNGIYTASVMMTLSGGRETIQSMMDECAANEPGMRITDFTWQSSKESSSWTLGMTLEIYMCEDTQQYILEQKAAREAAKAQAGEDTQAGADTEEDNITEAEE